MQRWKVRKFLYRWAFRGALGERRCALLSEAITPFTEVVQKPYLCYGNLDILSFCCSPHKRRRRVQVLDECDGDAEAAPERFSRARLQDAHALFALDREARSRNGADGLNFIRLSGLFHILLGTALKKLLPFWFKGSAYSTLMGSKERYSKVCQMSHRLHSGSNKTCFFIKDANDTYGARLWNRLAKRGMSTRKSMKVRLAGEAGPPQGRTLLRAVTGDGDCSCGSAFASCTFSAGVRADEWCCLTGSFVVRR